MDIIEKFYIDQLAELLHNCGINAFTHPTSKSDDEWTDYRRKIAAELLSMGDRTDNILHIVLPSPSTELLNFAIETSARSETKRAKTILDL